MRAPKRIRGKHAAYNFLGKSAGVAHVPAYRKKLTAMLTNYRSIVSLALTSSYTSQAMPRIVSRMAVNLIVLQFRG